MAITKDADRLLWERQRGETAKAYAAFCTFRDMGAGRTVHAVAKEYQKSVSLFYKWSRQWEWDERAAAWDNELAREALRAAKQERHDTTLRLLSIANTLFNFAEQYLANSDPAELTPKQAAEFIRLGAELVVSAQNGRIEDLKLELEENGGEDEDEQEDVVIYVPDNGLGQQDGQIALQAL